MNNVITVTQNRAYLAGLKIMDGENRFYLAHGDRLFFGIKKYGYQSDYLILKELSDSDYDEDTDSYLLRLSTGETGLDPGTYYYDIALNRSEGELEKIISCTELRVIKSIVRSDAL